MAATATTTMAQSQVATTTEPVTISSTIMSTSAAPADTPRQGPFHVVVVQILTVASQVHQVCQEDLTNLAKGVPSPLRETLLVVRCAMESLSQALLRLDLGGGSDTSSDIVIVLKQVQKLHALITRTPKKHTLVLIVERPALLAEMRAAFDRVANVFSTSKDRSASFSFLEVWEQQDRHLKQLIQQAAKEKQQLIESSDNGSSLEALLYNSSHPEQTQLLKVLDKKRRWHLATSTTEAKSVKSRQASRLEWWYLDKLMTHIQSHLETNQEAAIDTSMHLNSVMDNSSSSLNNNNLDASLQDSSLHASSLQLLYPDPNLPAWAVCPISKTIMLNPVTVRADCGHTVSKGVFVAWISQPNAAKARTCPVCGLKLKALFSKTNQQLQWQVQELEHERSLKTISHPTPSNNTDSDAGFSNMKQAENITTTTQKEQATLRRFSTGEFTKGRSLVGVSTTHSTTPVALRGEGQTPPSAPNTVGTPSVRPLLQTGESQTSLGETSLGASNHGSANAGGVPDKSKSSCGSKTNDQSYAKMLAAFHESDLLQKPQQQEEQQASNIISNSGPVFVQINTSRQCPLHDSALTFAEFTPQNSSSSLRVSFDEDSQPQKKSGTGAPLSKPSGNLKSQTINMDSSSGSGVRFRPVMVTNYIEPSPDQYVSSADPPTHAPKTTRTTVTYPMIDRSNNSKRKNKKNIISKIIHFMRNPTGKASSSSSESSPMANANFTLSMDASQGTARTADMSGSGHSRKTANSTSAPPKSILKNGRNHSHSTRGKSPPRKATQKVQSEEPSLLIHMATASMPLARDIEHC